ncbi:hypothetical protein L6R46_03760 [Myxococcota bacterium]|nr:hypothetical protein [Myxococcota bacterium]
MRALALLPALGLAGCDIFGDYILHPDLTYKVDVIELQTPCPNQCSTLAYELSDGEDGGLFVWPYPANGQWNPRDSRLFDSGGDVRPLLLESPGSSYRYGNQRRTHTRGGLGRRGYDCVLDFALSVDGDPAGSFVRLARVTRRGREEEVLNWDESELQDPDLNWTMAVVGEFPVPTQHNEDYEAQIFHIVGGPDERAVPNEDACDDDHRSFWFDLQFTPIHPYGAP